MIIISYYESAKITIFERGKERKILGWGGGGEGERERDRTRSYI